jgi:hypothetical protein
MRGRSNPPDMSATPMSADTPIAATPAQMTGGLGLGHPRSIPWAMLSLLGRAGGLLLLFVGTLVDIIAGSTPADCFTSHCGANISADIQYAILVSRLLWAIGAFGLAAGAGIKLHFLLREPETNGADENARFLARRRGEFLLFLAGVGILFVLLLTQTGAVAVPAI